MRQEKRDANDGMILVENDVPARKRQKVKPSKKATQKNQAEEEKARFLLEGKAKDSKKTYPQQ